MISSDGTSGTVNKGKTDVQQDSMGRWISLLHREARITIGNQLKQYNIGRGQHHVLMILYQQDGLIQDEIARLVCVDKATIGRAVKKLEARGFLVKLQDAKDKRAHRIYLTEKGRSMETTLRGILADWTRVLSSGFTPEERGTAIEMLKRMHGNALDHRKLREGERK